jgi:hypothetical protein
MSETNTLRLLQSAIGRLDELGDRLNVAEKREARERREAQARADDAAYLKSRDHLMRVDRIGREYQARADAVLQPWGLRAPERQDGEPLDTYRHRLLRRAQKRLPEGDQWYGHDLSALRDDALTNVESQVYGAVRDAASRNDSVPEGEMREIVRVDAGGTKRHEFIGTTSFVKQLTRPGRRVVGFLQPRDTHGRATA